MRTYHVALYDPVGSPVYVDQPEYFINLPMNLDGTIILSALYSAGIITNNYSPSRIYCRKLSSTEIGVEVIDFDDDPNNLDDPGIYSVALSS